MREKWREAVRYSILGAAGMLSVERRIELDRWLRGREEYRKLQLADWVLLSWGKSGRTWLRVMLSRFYQRKFGLPPQKLLEFDNFNRLDSRAPTVFCTHDNYLRDYTNHVDTKVDFYGKRIVMLVRDPRDVAVSQFFQWKYRMRPWKKRLNDYPLHGTEVSIYDFMMSLDVGLPRIIDYLNGWVNEFPNLPELLLVRYEDMRADPAGVLGEILHFTGTPGTDDEILSAVEFASFNNMRNLEEKKYFQSSGARMMAGDSKNPHSFKVRRAKVGGYRDYFGDRQLAEFDQMVERHLNPIMLQS